jgi:hypothetical protein
MATGPLAGFVFNTEAFQPTYGYDPFELPSNTSSLSLPAVNPIVSTYNPATAFGPSVVGPGNNTDFSTPIVPSGDNFKNFTTPSTVPNTFGDENNPRFLTPAIPGGGDGVPSTDPNASFTVNDTTTTSNPGGASSFIDPFTGFSIDPNTGSTDTGLGGNVIGNLPGIVAAGPLGLIPGVGSGIASGLGQNSSGQGGAWWNWAVTITLDFLKRFGLIFLGIVLIAAAAWAVTREGKGGGQ